MSGRRKGIGVSRIVAPGVVMAAFALSGCQQPPGGTGDNSEIEPNSTFRSATSISLASDQTAVLTGSIDQAGDVDVFNLGPVQIGDVVGVTITRLSPALQSAIALYDADGDIINQDTDTSVDDPSADPSIAHTVRADTGSIYLAITHNYVRASVGEYEASVSIKRETASPSPQSQILLLNFEGGVAYDPLIGTLAFGAFDAGDISPSYDGATAAMKSAIRSTFEQNYERFDVIILDTDNDELPLEGTYSQVFFGNYSSLAFGVAQNVDLYNQDPADTAIVFTESFVPHAFGDPPTAAEMAVAIGNVAAHEAGHLLGLSHVRDATALMDEASPAYTLLADQEFKRAVLSPLVFPLGDQNAPALLDATVGPDPLIARIELRAASPGLELLMPAAPPSNDALYENQIEGAPVGKCLTCMVRAGKAGLLPAGIEVRSHHLRDR